jgi:hypothetical protein
LKDLRAEMARGSEVVSRREFEKTEAELKERIRKLERKLDRR